MLDLRHQALQKGGECFCAHGGFTSQWDGASCRAARSASLPPRSSLGSSGCECHLLGAEPLHTNFTSILYTYAWCICVYVHMLWLWTCLFACRCTAFPHTCSWVKLWNFAKTDLKFLTFWGLSTACVWWHSNSTWALYFGVKGKCWESWHLVLPLFYWRQVGIFSCIAHVSWCGKLSQAPQWSNPRLAR